MSMIRISGLTFAHEGSARNIFDNLSLTLDTDWKLGLVGRNGRGKTTFLHLLEGRYPYSGTIAVPARCEYFPFAVPRPERLVGEVVGALCPDLEDWRLERELSLLDADPAIVARPFAGLSGGEKTKVLLATLFVNEGGFPLFPLIDEPTNHLDSHGRKAVAAYLRRKPGFVLVSHDRAFLDACVDHILALNKEDVEIQQGNYSAWKRNRDYADSFERARQDKLQKDVTRLEESSRRAAAWSDKTEKGKFGAGPVDRGFIGHKAAKIMKRSKSLENRRQEALEEKSGLLRNLEEAESLKIWPLKHHAAVLAEAVDLSLGYREEQWVFEGLRFTLRQGDRLAVRGKNGSGKSALLRLLAGEHLPHAGHFKRASGLVVSVVPQDLSHLQGTLEDFARAHKLDENLFRAVLSRLGLSKDFWRSDMRSFSDGQRKKAALARSLSEQAHLYIWDEPLNFMDVAAREQLEELILAFSPTLAFVEHDQAFTDAVATEVVDLS